MKRGDEALIVIRMAEADFNGHLEAVGAGWRLEVVVEDTAGDPDAALTKAASLYDDGVEILIGPGSDTELLGIKEYVDESGMLILDLVKNDRLSVEDLAKIVPGFRNRPSSNVLQEWIWAMVEDGRFDSLASALRLYHSMFILRKVANQDTEFGVDPSF